MNKKKIEIVRKVENIEELNKYLSPDFRKVVVSLKLVINVYDEFWGPCEIADMALKNFLDNPESNQTKTELLCVEKSIAEQSESIGDYIAKIKFASKPRYFICHVKNFFTQKGNIMMEIDGIDFPRLSEGILKHFALLDE